MISNCAMQLATQIKIQLKKEKKLNNFIFYFRQMWRKTKTGVRFCASMLEEKDIIACGEILTDFRKQNSENW